MRVVTSAAKIAKDEKRAEEKKVLSKLLVDEEAVLKDLDQLVEKTKQVFLIDSTWGTLKFLRFGDLSDPQRIAALLLGKYFANRLEIVTGNAISISQIAAELGRPMTTLSGPMGGLTSSGFIERLPTRKYRVAYHRIPDIINFLLERRKGEPRVVTVAGP